MSEDKKWKLNSEHKVKNKPSKYPKRPPQKPPRDDTETALRAPPPGPARRGRKGTPDERNPFIRDKPDGQEGRKAQRWCATLLDDSSNRFFVHVDCVSMGVLLPWLLDCLPKCLLVCLLIYVLACLFLCFFVCLLPCLFSCLRACLLACFLSCLHVFSLNGSVQEWLWMAVSEALNQTYGFVFRCECMHAKWMSES